MNGVYFLRPNRLLVRWRIATCFAPRGGERERQHPRTHSLPRVHDATHCRGELLHIGYQSPTNSHAGQPTFSASAMSPTVPFPSRPTHGCRPPARTPPQTRHGFAHFSANTERTAPQLNSPSSAHNSPLPAHPCARQSAVRHPRCNGPLNDPPQPNYTRLPTPPSPHHTGRAPPHTLSPKHLDTHHSTLSSLPFSTGTLDAFSPHELRNAWRTSRTTPTAFHRTFSKTLCRTRKTRYLLIN